MRASVAAGTRRGLNGALQKVILGFLSTLLALVVAFRDGRLAPLQADGGVADAPSMSGESSARVSALARTPGVPDWAAGRVCERRPHPG